MDYSLRSTSGAGQSLGSGNTADENAPEPLFIPLAQVVALATDVACTGACWSFGLDPAAYPELQSPTGAEPVTAIRSWRLCPTWTTGPGGSAWCRRRSDSPGTKCPTPWSAPYPRSPRIRRSWRAASWRIVPPAGRADTRAATAAALLVDRSDGAPGAAQASVITPARSSRSWAGPTSPICGRGESWPSSCRPVRRPAPGPIRRREPAR
jgi:hypothetical protein